MKIFWKYSVRGKIKHAFYAADRSSSCCGVIVPWYSKSTWQIDKEELAKRTPCKRCMRILE